MLNAVQNTIVVLAVVLGTLLTLTLLDRLWLPIRRRAHNDLIGWQLSILGTTYAVILGFMLQSVWADFGAADLNVDKEANALVDLSHLAAGLPGPQRTSVQTLTRSYAETVLRDDWPVMARNGVPEQSLAINNQLWQALLDRSTGDAGQAPTRDRALAELQVLTECRRIRLLQSSSRLPVILWLVLILGAVVTLFSACLFGAASQRVHLLQVGSLALLVALVLVAIADIDGPFQGSVRVNNTAFARSRDILQQLSDLPR